MYISFKGRLGIYLESDPKTLEGPPISIVTEYRAVGDRALEKE